MEIPLRDFGVTLQVRDEQWIVGKRAASSPNEPDLAAALRSALEQPRNFPALRRALTPDDRVAVVVDERLPQLGRLITAVVNYLTEAGIDPAAITLVSAAGSRQRWVDDLPDSVQDVRTEIHDPANRRAVSYLASTREGRRVYLNRTVVEADQSVVLSGCRFDAALGMHDGAGSLFPVLSDSQTIQDTSTRRKTVSAGGPPNSLHAEAMEVAWLLGVPFLVHLIEGENEGASHIIGGTVESVAQGQHLLEQRWRISYERPAQTVVATLTGDPIRHDFDALARAAMNAAQVVEPGGRIVILTRSHPSLGEAAQLLRQTDDLEAAARKIRDRTGAADQLAAWQWIQAARTASLYLFSAMPVDLAEELFTTPLQHARQVQRLVDAASSCVTLEDAHHSLAVLES